jgi:predicted TIM-barrel fold metal-dependent hydrolase
VEGYRIVDADGHVVEDDEELNQYLDPPYNKGREPGYSIFPSLDGWPRQLKRAWRRDIAVEQWLSFMDDTGIEQAVLYPTAGLAIGLIQDAEWACLAARAYNTWLADRFSSRSPRLHGVALLPVQDVDEAVKELRRGVTELGFVGGLLPSCNYHNFGFGHPRYRPLFAEAERLGCPLSIHGGSSAGYGLDLARTFAHVIALEHPFGLMYQFTSIILEGVLEDHPNLRLGFLEAGAGWLPYMLDRLDEQWERQGDVLPWLRKRPSEYVQQHAVYITCEVEEKTLPGVLAILGADRVMWPSDFPHERRREAFYADLPEFFERDDLTAEVRRAILFDNPARFYNLPPLPG